MGNKTIYIKDDGLWQRARELAGKDGLSSAIQGFLAKFVEEAELTDKGFARRHFKVRPKGSGEVPDKHIAFNGRLLHHMQQTDIPRIPPWAVPDTALKVADLEDPLGVIHEQPCWEIAAFETKSGKLVLTLNDTHWNDFENDAVTYYAVYENLQALGNDEELIERIEESDRITFLDALSKRLGQEWAIWLE